MKSVRAVVQRVRRASVEVEGRVRQIWRKGFLLPAYFPSEPVEVDDDAGQPPAGPEIGDRAWRAGRQSMRPPSSCCTMASATLLVLP